MLSAPDRAILCDSPIEDIEFDVAETRELDNLKGELANAAYPEKILRQNWAYERLPARQEHLHSFAASGLRPPLLTCLSAAAPRKAAAFRSPASTSELFPVFISSEAS